MSRGTTRALFDWMASGHTAIAAFCALMALTARDGCSTPLITEARTIRRPGTFALPGTRTLLLRVWIESGLLRYELRGQNRVLFRIRRNASIFHRWGLYWESDERIWVSSSDIGSTAVVKSESGTYDERGLHGDQALMEAVPAPFCPLLAPLLRERFPACR